MKIETPSDQFLLFILIFGVPFTIVTILWFIKSNKNEKDSKN